MRQSCVDKKTSALKQYMTAILGVLRRRSMSKELENYQDAGGLSYDATVEVLRKAGAFQLINRVCCEKVPQPELHVDKTQSCPQLIPLRCTHGKNGNIKDRCKQCGVEKKLGILDALNKTEVTSEIVEVMEWRDSARQGILKGKQNTQRELHPEEMSVKELTRKFTKQVEKCIPHYQEICWMRLAMKTDLGTLPKDELLIFTDFAAVMSLRSFQTKNSSVDGHAVNENFVCLYNRRKVTVTEKRMENEVEIEVNGELYIFTVDVHHFFAETISKGKKVIMLCIMCALMQSWTSTKLSFKMTSAFLCGV